MIRGGTLTSTMSLASASGASVYESGIVTFGVLTVDSIEQAIERSGTKAGNKGDSRQHCREMVSRSKV